MEPSTAPVTVTKHKSALTALAGLRVYLGLVWFTYGRSKFEPNWAGGHHEFLSAVSDAAKSTGVPFRSLLVHVVIPNQAVFAQLIAFGETLVGISLILGLLTRAGAAGGIFLAANYYFATGRYLLHFGVESIELMLLVLSLYVLLSPSAAVLSIDRWITRKRAACF
jgi:thiosulfate dehydrogenase [quinone] large subunit